MFKYAAAGPSAHGSAHLELALCPNSVRKVTNKQAGLLWALVVLYDDYDASAEASAHRNELHSLVDSNGTAAKARAGNAMQPTNVIF